MVTAVARRIFPLRRYYVTGVINAMNKMTVWLGVRNEESVVDLIILPFAIVLHRRVKVTFMKSCMTVMIATSSFSVLLRAVTMHPKRGPSS